MNALALLLSAALGLTAASAVAAHGGGLNAEGCHTSRKTGDYHCHRAPAKPAAAPAQEIQPVAGQGGTVHYRNCSEARAAGAAPVRRGDPGYAAHLDRDGDGVGCE